MSVPLLATAPTRTVNADTSPHVDECDARGWLFYGTDHGRPTEEDYDPTPVPTGCPGCHLRGPRCERCPR